MIDDITISDLRNLNTLLADSFGFDFGQYAQSSFKRRVIRVLELNKMTGVAELVSKLKATPDYYATFLNEITVNTTEMFRDPAFWRSVKEEMANRFADRQTIRIWHAGCSSGEEVYSMGIVLRELGFQNKAKAYATDINNSIMEEAKEGIYPKRKMDINFQNFSRYSNGEGDLLKYCSEGDRGEHKMDKTLLDHVTFREHNLATELEPFMKFDLILCRNVLIYFNNQLQEKVLGLYHRSLLEGGLLCIGTKEAIIGTVRDQLYLPVNDAERIYKRK
jgi:chemotaxis protein methyltransferase CheR